MKKKNQSEQKNHLLRRRAEKLLAGKSGNLDGLSKADAQSLIHELRVHQIELEMQNEELRGAQIELEESRNRYADLYDFAPVGYFTLDKKGLILEVNLTGAALLGVERKNLIKQAFSRCIASEGRDEFYFYRKQLLGTDTRQTSELKMLRKDGTPFYAQLEGIAVFDSEGNFSHFRVAMLDITERRRMEEQIKASLKEKEALLKEIQHRVKNNLQVISSLLNLQSQYARGKRVRDMFNESQNRVKSMALIHEILYQSKDLAKIDFAEYILNLGAYLFQSYGVKSDDIKLKISVDNISLDVDTAILCGLIINELISNSLKHAFPKGRTRSEQGESKGEICINLRSDNNGIDEPAGRLYTLIVSDNGISFSKDLDFRNTKSLGLQ